MEQRLRNFNNITLGYTDNTRLHAAVWRTMALSATVNTVPRLEAGHFERKSTENLFGTSSGQSYDKIGNRSIYSLTAWQATASVPVQLTLAPTSVLTVEGRVTVRQSKESLSSTPAREVMARHLDATLRVHYSTIARRHWLLQPEAGVTVSRALARRSQLEGIDVPELAECVQSNAAFTQADAVAASVRVRATRMTALGIAFGITAAYEMQHFQGLTTAHAASITLTTTF